jgi:phosphatidylinositol alpha-mannosyltransferase
MRIGMISPYSLSVPGGVQGQVLGLARAIRARGESVRVLAPCDGPPPEPFVTPLGNCVPLGANGSIAPVAPDLAAQLRTIRALRDEDFDVLHLHEPFAPGPTMTAMLVKSAPIVCTFHSAGSSFAYDIFKPLTTRASKQLDLRFAVSEDAEALAKSALGGEYERAFNAVEVSKFRSLRPHKTDGQTILFVARHEERKGLAILLEAFALLDPSTRLWIAGVGPETAELQSRHAGDPRISWLGELDENSKMERMLGADIFCAPSLHGESFGIVLLEAMAAETAVVASDLPGYAKVTRHGKDAVLVPPGDVDRLAEVLRTTLSDRSLRDKLIASGSSRVAELSMRRLADLYLDAYRRVLDRRVQPHSR